jgi:dTDP-4-dehydrorhamnose reductase
MPQYLVLGASSSIGKNFYEAYKKNILLATSYSNVNKKFKKFNLLTDKFESLLRLKKKPTHVIIFSAESKPDMCHAYPNKTYKLNFLIPKKIILSCLKKKITPVVFSSEFVSSGKIKNLTEKNTSKPILVYGKQKQNLENFILKNKLPVLVLRLAKVYGHKINDNTLLTSSIKQLISKTQLKVARDQYFNPVYVKDVIKVINLLCVKNFTGLFNLSGPKRLSRYEIVKRINEYFRFKKKLKPCLIDDFDLPEKRPKDVSLSNKKLIKALNYKFKTVDFVIKKIKSKYSNVLRKRRNRS